MTTALWIDIAAFITLGVNIAMILVNQRTRKRTQRNLEESQRKLEESHVMIEEIAKLYDDALFNNLSDSPGSTYPGGQHEPPQPEQ